MCVHTHTDIHKHEHNINLLNGNSYLFTGLFHDIFSTTYITQHGMTEMIVPVHSDSNFLPQYGFQQTQHDLWQLQILWQWHYADWSCNMVKIWTVVFWVMLLCGLVGNCYCFEGTCCFQLLPWSVQYHTASQLQQSRAHGLDQSLTVLKT
jgi:hypothetical protein